MPVSLFPAKTGRLMMQLRLPHTCQGAPTIDGPSSGSEVQKRAEQ